MNIMHLGDIEVNQAYNFEEICNMMYHNYVNFSIDGAELLVKETGKKKQYTYSHGCVSVRHHTYNTNDKTHIRNNINLPKKTRFNFIPLNPNTVKYHHMAEINNFNFILMRDTKLNKDIAICKIIYERNGFNNDVIQTKLKTSDIDGGMEWLIENWTTIYNKAKKEYTGKTKFPHFKTFSYIHYINTDSLKPGDMSHQKIILFHKRNKRIYFEYLVEYVI